MPDRDFVVCRLEGGWPGIWIGAQEAKFLAQVIEIAGNGSADAQRVGAILRACWVDYDEVDKVPRYVKATDG